MLLTDEKKSKKSKRSPQGNSSGEPIEDLNESSISEKVSKKSKKTEQLVEIPVENGLEDTNGDDISEKKSKKRKAKKEEEEDNMKSSEKSPKEKKLKLDDEAQKEEDEEDNPGSFKKFGISQFVADKLKGLGVKHLFPVQYESFNDIMSGSDLILQSRTGSGKTFSFAIPLIEMLHRNQQTDNNRKKGKIPLVLVLTPTRELAKQVSDSFSNIAKNTISVLSVYGGIPVFQHEKSVRGGVDVLVGTPGRIQDLINRGSLDLTNLKHVVLDEVDRMLDMGFADNVDEILQNRYNLEDANNNPQTLLFSATMPAWVKQTASKYLRPDYKTVNLTKGHENQTSKTVQHLAIQCSYIDRPAMINSVIRVYSGSEGRCIIFCQTKKDADELALSNEMKSDAHVIHGDIPQDKREMVLKGFREGKYRCLVATDVAARGLDIPEVDLVIQCSPPQDVESYIHRSGRTGRAGREGTCVLFFKKNEERELRMVESRANIKLRIIGPPSPADIIKASAEDAARALNKVSKQASHQFEDLAKKLIEERGAVECLSEALAVISGNTEVKQRSLITSRENMITYHFETNCEVRHLSYVWNALKKYIDEELKETITSMRFCKDRLGCVFDIPTDRAEKLESQWQDGKYDTLSKAEILPELEEQPQHSFSNERFQGNSHYRGNNRYQNNGFRGGRGGYQKSNGWKRNY